eukprot:g7740.t1
MWMQSNGINEYTELFLEHGVLSVTDLKDNLNASILFGLGLKIAQVNKILFAAKQLPGALGQKVSPTKWSVTDVGQWLSNVCDAGQYCEVFSSNFVNGQMLLTLTDTDLETDLNVTSSMQRRRILIEIDNLKSNMRSVNYSNLNLDEKTGEEKTRSTFKVEVVGKEKQPLLELDSSDTSIVNMGPRGKVSDYPSTSMDSFGPTNGIASSLNEGKSKARTFTKESVDSIDPPGAGISSPRVSIQYPVGVALPGSPKVQLSMARGLSLLPPRSSLPGTPKSSLSFPSPPLTPNSLSTHLENSTMKTKDAPGCFRKISTSTEAAVLSLASKTSTKHPKSSFGVAPPGVLPKAGRLTCVLAEKSEKGSPSTVDNLDKMVYSHHADANALAKDW